MLRIKEQEIIENVDEQIMFIEYKLYIRYDKRNI